MCVSLLAALGRVRSFLVLLAALASGALLGQPVKVVPQRMVLVGGEASAFSVQVPGCAGGPWEWTVPDPRGGTVDKASGSYQAPRVEEPSLFQVKVTSPFRVGARGEATINVLPRSLFERSHTGRGADGVDPCSEAFPFLIPGAGRRFGPNAKVGCWYPAHPLKPCRRLVAGFNLPVTLRWEPVEGAEAELLSFREGDEVRCLDVTGRGSETLRLRARVSGGALEALRHAFDDCSAWKSLGRAFTIGVRGMVPFAGRASAEGGSCGPGGGATFREPAGIVLRGGGLHNPATFVVADPGSHTLHTLSREGEADGGWGCDGERGYRDGGPGEARFDHPTFLAAMRGFQSLDPYRTSNAFLLSDSGNHVIRRVDALGEVSTLAGTPGEAGHRDADDPRQALFNNPQGLVMDGAGTLFVADQGNHALRRISKAGQVTTLAGGVGLEGFQDGFGPQARFSHLVGLTEADGYLYGVDGHAVRRVSKEGEVVTILGAPDRPGFLDDWERGTAALAGVPCLDRPSGILALGRRLYLADQGNHAVREFDLAAGTLKTLAGDPQHPQTRYGLLRDGLDAPLDPAYAAVGMPRGLAACESGDLYVCTGTCVARICRQGLPEIAPGPELRLEPPTVKAGEAFQVYFRVPTRPPGAGESRPLTFWVEFRNADGTVAGRQEGAGLGDRWLGCQGCFFRSGEGTVILRSLTDQGYSLGARKSVQVR